MQLQMPEAEEAMAAKAARFKTLEDFCAIDPWNGWQPAAFRLDVAWTGNSTPSLPLHDPTLPLKFAITSLIDRQPRQLPDSLAGLWKDGKLPSHRLPGALYDLEPALAEDDYFPFMTLTPAQRFLRMAAGPAAGLALLLAAALASVAFPDIAREAMAYGLGAATVLGGLPLLWMQKLRKRRADQAKLALLHHRKKARWRSG